MKLELFGSHEQKDVTEIDCEPRDLDLKSENISFEGSGHVVCMNTGDEDVAQLRCEVSVPVLLQCARCLDEFHGFVGREFSLVVRKLRKGEAIPEHSDDDDNDDEDRLIYIDQDTNTLDITDYVRDAIILSIPLKPMCRENCRGLCSVCGNNLNEYECGCKREISDPRWKDLSRLFNT